MKPEDVVFGPCPCRGCGEAVYWNGMGWRNVWRSASHACRRTKHGPHRMIDQTAAEWNKRGAA